MSDSSEKKYWFYAKKHGYGWGLPASWQGWIVMAGYFALIFGGMPVAIGAGGPGAYIGYVMVLTGFLIAICWLKGEPLRWR